MTKPITLPSGEYMLVEVPENRSYRIQELKGIWLLGWINNEGKELQIWQHRLPKNNYSIIGLAAAITEDMAAGIVTELPIGNRWPSYDNRVWQYTAIASLHTLVRSHGFEPGNCLILKID